MITTIKSNIIEDTKDVYNSDLETFEDFAFRTVIKKVGLNDRF